jgi:hypothetical protein
VLWGGCRTPQGATFEPLISRRARGPLPSLRRILSEYPLFSIPGEEEAALAEVQRLDAAVEGPSVVLASSFEVEVLPPVSPSEARPDSAEGGNDAEGAAPPPADT